ncbi:MAG: bifunctional 2-polyprenyl-6-hydroxyphenol methylase/3-demethylubiquinol 3-O-methyltransferase UbiG [Acetobacteraceae bacterium]|nr:bifunctional 2-polyprenyl-6-hydroxyphenol methylase/3-demethylubiquinol 3-O-methyltransferase UbiG [Acetobacteraceae bacterium]
MQTVQHLSVSPDEIARFDALASEWWDPKGPMRPLHAMNPARIAWINRLIAQPSRILDIGCGAGPASEALALLGHDVTGDDAAPGAIAAARAHAGDLPITYRTNLEDGVTFPVITALEVIEHVPDPASFLATLAATLEPSGLLVVSTLNRTKRAWLVAILGAEYVLRMLPTGTHDWTKFLSPAELSALARAAGLRCIDVAGLQPGIGGWRATRNTSVNYIAAFRKA